jgi:hypothetical protein
MTMTTAAPQKSSPPLRPALKLVAALTLAACAWVAWHDDERLPAKTQRDGNASTPIPFNQATQSARSNRDALPRDAVPFSQQPSASASPAWPEALGVAERSQWPALAGLGGAAWASAATPTSAQIAAKTKPVASVTKPVLASAEPTSAPAFPYVLIGRIEDGEAQALLSGPNRSFGVKAGEVIDGQWRVDAVQAQSLLLTWLPSSVKKTVAFAAS